MTSCSWRFAAKYFKLLSQIDWDDAEFLAGIREGLNKFLSNTFLFILREKESHKHHRTHLVSPAALKQRLNERNYVELIYEHVVPKRNYIQRPCEDRAKEGTLTVEFILDILKRYWVLATVTKTEDRVLPHAMPFDWDQVDVFARYRTANIRLVRNPHFLLNWTP